MPVLVDLPNELLEEILGCIAPNDLDNFVLSCKLLHKLATKRLQEHKVLRRYLTRVDNRGPFKANQFPELLHQILVKPFKADYVQQVDINDWYWRFFDPDLDDEAAESCPHHPYAHYKMQLFKTAVDLSDSIPIEDKERWMLRIESGDENPVLALLLSKLHYLASIKITLISREDRFLFQTLERAVKEPGSPSFSRLLEVEISGINSEMHNLCLLTVFAALPSVTSLKAYGLFGKDWYHHSALSLTPHSSNLRDLALEACNVSCSALVNLIKSAKSLRSFTYSYPENPYRRYRSDTPSAFTWVCAALFEYTSTSLEELTLRGPPFNPNSRIPECSFKSYQVLRVLSIDYALLMGGDKILADSKIVKVLPASLEILNLFRCYIYSAWFKELVK
ncbi:MAG: hypothetical protein ASARMPREDX12_007228 [Alectoria sarmentosa]|nr:MAG: hypothetical protein ASARMPREDX12_007228 [Alectoria sarmentosa]